MNIEHVYIEYVYMVFSPLPAAHGLQLHKILLNPIFLLNPIPESIDAAVDLLRAHENRIDMLGLSVEDIRSMLEFVLDRNYFEFNGEQYRQRNGLAMGNHLAPPLAIIFMSSLEVKVLDSCDC